MNIVRLQDTLERGKTVLARCGPQPEPWDARAVTPRITVGVLDELTEREVEVLRLIAEGQSTKDLAHTLGISFKTAVCHRSRILQKLGVHESVSLVRLAIRAGLIEP